MTFDEIWKKIGEMNTLPDTAIQQIPLVLSDDTKKRLTRKSPEEVVMILQSAIAEVNHGSIQSVDSLVRKML